MGRGHNTIGIIVKRFKIAMKQPGPVSRPEIKLNGLVVPTDMFDASLAEQVNANTAAVKELQRLFVEMAEKNEARGVTAPVKPAR